MVSRATGDTFARLLERQAAERGEATAIREKRRGIWRGKTWGEFADEAAALACALAEMGVGAGERVALIGENRPNLFVGMAAAHRLGATVVALYPDAPASEVGAHLRAVGATVVFAEDQQQVDKVVSVLPDCPAVHAIVYDDDRGMRHYRQTGLVQHAELVARGRETAGPGRDALAAAVAAADPAGAAFVFFTAGADAAPKGVVFSHAALIGRARAAATADGVGPEDRTLAIFPPGWACQTMFSYVQALVTGHCICCPESSDTLLADMREVAPTYLLTTPRMLDAIVAQVSFRMEDTGGLNLRLYRNALALAERVARARLEGKAPSGADRLKMTAYEYLIYAPLRDTLGMSRIRSAYCTGDRLDPAMLEFFRAIGINLKQLYGATETGFFAAMHRDGAVVPDTVGEALPDLELSLGADGAILVRGEGLMSGYLDGDSGRDAAGWLPTGDAGVLDAKGQLRVTDRTESLGRLADGTPFAPRMLESRLRVSPYVREAVVFGDGRGSAAALVDINTRAVGRWADGHELPYTGHADLASQEAVYGLIAEWIAAVNVELARDPGTAPLQIRRFLLLPEELSADDGLLTPTGKLRRGAIAARYAGLVEALYAGRTEAVLDRGAGTHDGGAIGLKIRDAAVVGGGQDRRAA